MRTHLTFLILGTAFFVNACKTPDAADANAKFVQGCADSVLSSRSLLYFGPSNQIGPGSIWSRLGDLGGYQPQWRNEDLGIMPRLIDRGASFKCDLSSSSTFAADAGLSVLSTVTNASADAKADFARGRVVKVSSTGAAWDTVVAGPYTVHLASLPPAVRTDVMGANRLIMRRALRIDGYKVVMDFDTAIKPEIKAKYAGRILGNETVGEVGAHLTANWTAEDKLELSASDSVYVAGEFAQLVNGQWVGTRGDSVVEDLGDKWVRPYTARH